MAVAARPGQPFPTPAGLFVRYVVLVSPRAQYPKRRAIADAKIMARVAGYQVVEVVEAVEQPRDDGWLVELGIRK